MRPPHARLMDSIRLGRGIRALRHRRGWRQEDLAAAAGVSQSEVSRIELGQLEAVPVLRARRGRPCTGCRNRPETAVARREPRPFGRRGARVTRRASRETDGGAGVGDDDGGLVLHLRRARVDRRARSPRRVAQARRDRGQVIDRRRPSHARSFGPQGPKRGCHRPRTELDAVACGPGPRHRRRLNGSATRRGARRDVRDDATDGWPCGSSVASEPRTCRDRRGLVSVSYPPSEY